MITEFIPSKEFPYLHAIILIIVCFSTAISIQGLFSYVGFMVLDFKSSENENTVGYYAGYICSSMMLGRLLTSVYWGQLADRIGRKPAIITGCISIIICSIGFGFSTNIYSAIFFRFLLGLSNPIWGIAKTLTSELFDQKYRPTAVGLTVGCWNIGLVVGPSIGGLLSRPAKTFPEFFKHSPVFHTYPYCLPNLITAFLAGIGLFLSIFYFPETLPVASKTESTSHDQEQPLLDAPELSKGASVKELLAMRSIPFALFAYFLLSMVQIMFDELCPLWAMSSRSKGGLSYNQIRIGGILGSVGLFLTAFTLVGYPIVARLLGPVQLYQVGQFGAGPFIILVPLVAQWIQSTPRMTLSSVTFMIALVKMFNQLGVASMTLIINSMVSAKERASLNGLSLAVGSLAKFIGPIVVSTGFAWSISPAVNNHLFVFTAIAMIAFSAGFIPLRRAEARERVLI